VPAANVDEYLAALPADQRAALEALRALVRATDPTAVESITYGVPTYKHAKKPLIYFGAAKGHCAIYGMAAEGVEFAAELEGYSRSKGTIRFQPGKPVPDDVVVRMITARIRAIEG
jgi:uncharacterized protein YdhG (YjbR/CyaY superfamily)